MLQGLSEIRRHLALGQVAAADAQAEELLRALQAPSISPDGGLAAGIDGGQGPSTGR